MSVINGDGGDNTLPGGNDNDTIIGGGGNDLVQGLGGNDLLRGDDTTPGGGGGGLALTPTAQGYLTAGNSLVTGLGGSAGFGENTLGRNDDGSTSQISLAGVFTGGLNFFGSQFSSLFVNNNGNITFNSAQSTFTPSAITGSTNNRLIAAFFADVDTNNSTLPGPTPGGNSTGSNLVYYDLDTVNHVFTATWDDVGYFSSRNDKLNAFQIQLIDRGSGDFDIVFRYEAINWTTGNASGGTNGLGGTVARAGYTAGNGVNFFELPQAGNQDGMLTLDTTDGNSGRTGVWLFQVRSGAVSSPGSDTLEGGAGNDSLEGGAQDDTINGGTGTDTALFSGSADAYTVTRVNATTFDVSGPDGNDRLIDVELAQFGGGAPATLDSLAERPPVELTATGTRPLDMGTNFNVPSGLLTQFLPIQVFLDQLGFHANLLNGGTLAATESSLNLTFSLANLQFVNGAAVGETLSYTGTGSFGAIVNPIRTVLADNGATVGGPPIAGTSLLGLVSQLQTVVTQIPIDQIRLDTLTSVVNGQPHYEITNLGLTGTELQPFFGGVITPGGTLDLPGLIAHVGERPSIITGSPGNDTIISFGGNDSIDGSGGLDTIIVPDEVGDTTMNSAGGVTTITGGFGSVTITGVEAINFNDNTTVLNSSLPVLSIVNSSLTEGASGSANALFTVNLTAPAPQGGVTAEVQIAGTGNRPASIGVDFSAPAGIVTIPAGQVSATLAVPVLGDSLPESDETFTVRLRNVTNAIAGFASDAVGTIVNDDIVPTLSVAPAQVTEGNAGSTNLTFTITLSTAHSQTVTVPVSTINGSALAGSDYVALSTVVTIPAGQSSAIVQVSVFSDTAFEMTESFLLVLGNPTGGAAIGASGTTTLGTIANDDSAVLPGINGSTLNGDGADNFLVGSALNDSINGQGGADTEFGNEASDVLIGGAGNDFIVADFPANFLFGSADFVDVGDGNDNVFGGGGNDTLVGGNGDDLLAGDTGDNMIFGGNGNNALFGFDGADSLEGGNDGDIVFGLSGPDFIFTQAGFDLIISGGPTDGAADADFINAADGGSQVFAGSGDDTIVAGNGDDFMLGEDGADRMASGAGNDALFGGAGNDTLGGGEGDDIIIAEGGDDRLGGGPGNDNLNGGPGADVFFYPNLSSGTDTIVGFVPSDDTVELSAAFGITAQQARALTVTVGLGSVLNLPTGDSIIFAGVSLATLTAADFVIV